MSSVQAAQRVLSILAMISIVMIGLTGGVAADESGALDTVLAKLAPPPSGEALAKIPDTGRKLLALRSYVRYGPKIADRWSWTEEQIKAFQGSPEQQALLAAVAAVNEHFKAANPGYEIYVHGTVRSLDDQLASWNKNESVGRGAEEILAAYKAAFGEDGLQPEKIDVKRLDAWLRGFMPSKRANLAAPGLTLHGRGSAIDFQVMKDGRIHAGANSKEVESVWRAEGWDQKLKASIEAAGPLFTGPLLDPDEPWHYELLAAPFPWRHKLRSAIRIGWQQTAAADLLDLCLGFWACVREELARTTSRRPATMDRWLMRGEPRCCTSVLRRSTTFSGAARWPQREEGRRRRGLQGQPPRHESAGSAARSGKALPVRLAMRSKVV